MALSLGAAGTGLAKCQCGSGKVTKTNGGSVQDATRSADQRKQMDGDNSNKVEAATRGGQNGNEERGKTMEVYLAQWVGMEYRESVYEKIQRKVRRLFLG